MKKTLSRRNCCLLGMLSLLVAGGRWSSVSAEVVLVRDGEPAAYIRLPPESGARGRDMTFAQAASELVEHIRLISGVALPVVMPSENGAGWQSVRIERAQRFTRETVNGDRLRNLLPINIGDAADPELDDWIWAQAHVSDAFAVVVAADGIQLRGLLPVGAQHAVYELLEQLGVRWHKPLEAGWVIPEKQTVKLAKQRIAKTPSEELRFLAPVTPRSTLYTISMKAEHVQRVRRSPYVAPTASADDQFVIGITYGWNGGPEIFFRTAHVPPITDRNGAPAFPAVIPPQNIYGYRITDPHADGPKTRIVLTDGNHSEFTGSWSFHGMIEFLLSDDARAEELRRRCEFYVYPLVNPDGRYLLTRVTNPELIAAGWNNHLRTWISAGMFSTGDVLTEAIRYDTGGYAEYLIDFHSNGTCIYTPPWLTDSAFIRAMTAREPEMRASGWQRASTVEWALHPEGLNAPYAFQPEHGPWESLERCQAIGRSYALTLHDVVTGAVTGDPGKKPAISPSPNPVGHGAGELLKAALQGNFDAAEHALADGADVNAMNVLGTSPLHAAAEKGEYEIAGLLIEKGVGVNLANRRGWTPLHYAARYGHTGIATLLLANEADPNARNTVGDTPLHLAAAYQRNEIVSALLNAGAEKDIRGRWHRTPTDWAQRLGYARVVEQLQPPDR